MVNLFLYLSETGLDTMSNCLCELPSHTVHLYVHHNFFINLLLNVVEYFNIWMFIQTITVNMQYECPGRNVTFLPDLYTFVDD